jgi:predicted NUDIX family NTP pyrophosphohydrolase
MPKKSAGLMLYRRTEPDPEILLVHPGGPFWRKKDEGAWTIPKGEFSEDEDPLTAAKREFEEETGTKPPAGEFIKLKPIKQANNKIVHAWAIEGEFDPSTLRSNTFQMEWPPRTGRLEEFPEVDRAKWFTPEEARKKILAGQIPLIEELLTVLELV